MKITFLVNNYLTIWNLLYGPSISMKTHAFKQKLWITYKKEYKAIEHNKDEILMDIKNFIPDDNTLYELLEDTKVFTQLEKESEKHRIELMKIWDKSKKQIIKELNDILRVPLLDYQVVVLHPAMDVCLTSASHTTIGWGKRSDLENKLYTMLNIIFTFFKTQISYQDQEDYSIAEAILELAILNECYTRIDKSNYLAGSKKLESLKRELYPYFLMYLGIDLEKTTPYMMRDNIAFDIEKYTNEKQLRNLDIFAFIDFIVRNKKHILNGKKEFV